MKKILYINDGVFHPPLLARSVLKTLFEQGSYELMAIRNFEKLPELDLAAFDAVVVYIHHQTISEPALQAFERFVHAGGGVLGIHSATACFKDTPLYTRILGGRFTGHGPVSRFEIEPLSGPNEPFDGLASFAVTDELYLHEFQPGIRTHFSARHEGIPQPVVWTYYYGTGKVCCAVPGHLFQTIRNEIYQEVLLRGLAWVSG